MVNSLVKIKENTYVRKKDGNIYDIGNKTGLYVRPFEDKHEIIVDDILFVLFEKDFERET